MDHLTAINDVLDSVNTYRRARSAEMLLQQARAEIGETLQAHRGSAQPSLSRLLKVSGELDMSHAPIEMAQSDALARAYGREPRQQNGFFLPIGLQRDAAVGTSSAGGYLVSSANELRIGTPGGSNGFLDLCTVVRPGSATGAQRIGTVNALPTVTVLANEQSSISEQTPTTTQTLMVPTHLTSYMEASRQFALQSEGGAAAIANLLTTAIRQAAGLQIIAGSGSSGQVTGLTVNSDVATATGGTLAQTHIVAALETVEKAAGDGALAWVVTAPAAKIMRQRATISGGNAILQDGKIGGYPAIVIGGTTDATAAFGRWKDLLVYEWSPMEVAVNPFATFTSAIIGVRAWLPFSAAPLCAASFYTITSIT